MWQSGAWRAGLALAWCAVVFLAGTGRACGAASETATDAFLTRVYTNASKKKLPYRLLTPLHYDPAKSYPIILYLHGAAARGDDNAEPLNWGPKLFLDQGIREKHDFFLLVPQCPRAEGWTQSTLLGSVREGQSLVLALELMRTELPKQFSIDPKRRYLTGVSMGGHAVWTEMILHPGFFAAAIPVCAAGNASSVTEAAARFPVWVFHSDDDHLVPVEYARQMVKAWRAHGGLAKYTEYTGLKHSSWKKAYADPAMYDWLFAQTGP